VLLLGFPNRFSEARRDPEAVAACAREVERPPECVARLSRTSIPEGARRMHVDASQRVEVFVGQTHWPH
jgi:hypothetical protein